MLDLARTGGATALGRMAEALRTAENDLEARPAQAAVLTGDDDHALAAALVATKLHVPLYRCAPAPGEGGNARIHALLADANLSDAPSEAVAALLAAVAANRLPDA